MSIKRQGQASNQNPQPQGPASSRLPTNKSLPAIMKGENWTRDVLYGQQPDFRGYDMRELGLLKRELNESISSFEKGC